MAPYVEGNLVRLRRLTDGMPLARLARQALTAARLSVIGAVTEGMPDDHLVLILKPGPEQAQLLGTKRNVVCLVASVPSVRADVLARLQDLALELVPYTTAEVAIVISDDDNVEAACREHSDITSVTVVGLSATDMRLCRPNGHRELFRLIQAQYYSRDLYSYNTPIREAGAFFGRRQLVDELSGRLKKASNNVGIFGLRRMGKTSLLYQIHTKLRQADAAYIAHLDLERVDAVEASAEYFFWALGETIFDAHKVIRNIDGLRLFGRSSVFRGIDKTSVLDDFRHDLTLVLDSIKRPLIVSLDELERIFPETSPTEEWANAYRRIWALLRGIAQERDRRLAFLVAGTNPRPIEAAEVAKAENPIYEWIDAKFLQPLAADESAELLASIGALMGLEWTEAACSYVFSRVGGHPLLTRAFGSLIHRKFLPREQATTVGADDVADVLDEFLLERSQLLEQMLVVLEEQYGDEHTMLTTLAMGHVGDFRAYARIWPDNTRHLIGYGLVDIEHQPPKIKIEVLQTHIQRKERAIQNLPTARRHAITVGDIVGSNGYEVLYELGQPSGFSDVFLARATREVSGVCARGEQVALKVLHPGARFEQLQREVDALRRVLHPNVVRMLDYGTDLSGRHFIVMEYLEGSSLAERCDKSHRLSAEDARSYLRILLDALCELHPDLSQVETLRTAEQISSLDLETLLRARHGYIHRDIKPENVIVVSGRGPVLIDFNISSKAGAPSITYSQTPGYHRPTALGEPWSPEHDLYALGVTIAQGLAGVPYGGSRDPDEQAAAVDDLLVQASEQSDDVLMNVLERLCSVERTDYYRTAREALKDLR